jgi:intracellular sulfur oxidation DsrE/DsrF family protein
MALSFPPLPAGVSRLGMIPLVGIMLTAFAAHAGDKPDDAYALQGVDTGRILWDITQGSPALLKARLAVMEETFQDMVRQHVKPEMVLAFRGAAVLLLDRNLSHTSFEDGQDARDVQASLAEFVALPGVRLEACYIAMRRGPMTPEDLVDGVHAVGNTFLSTVGYSQKGFVSIPIN